MEKNSNGWETVCITILLPALSVVCSIGINYFEEKVGLFPVLIVLLAILVIIPISIYVGTIMVSNLGRNTIETEMDLEIKLIQQKIAENRIMNGICKEEQLALMEKTYPFEEIWLISPDLLTEINSGIYAGVIKENLKKGTKYKYFVPETEINKVRVQIFRNSCGNSKNLEIYYLSDDFFFLVPRVDFAIYEPMKSITDGKKGYIGLPIQGTAESFAVLMNNDFVDAVIGKLAERLNMLE